MCLTTPEEHRKLEKEINSEDKMTHKQFDETTELLWRAFQPETEEERAERLAEIERNKEAGYEETN